MLFVEVALPSGDRLQVSPLSDIPVAGHILILAVGRGVVDRVEWTLPYLQGYGADGDPEWIGNGPRVTLWLIDWQPLVEASE